MWQLKDINKNNMGYKKKKNTTKTQNYAALSWKIKYR